MQLPSPTSSHNYLHKRDHDLNAPLQFFLGPDLLETGRAVGVGMAVVTPGARTVRPHTQTLLGLRARLTTAPHPATLSTFRKTLGRGSGRVPASVPGGAGADRVAPRLLGRGASERLSGSAGSLHPQTAT